MTMATAVFRSAAARPTATRSSGRSAVRSPLSAVPSSGLMLMPMPTPPMLTLKARADDSS